MVADRGDLEVSNEGSMKCLEGNEMEMKGIKARMESLSMVKVMDPKVLVKSRLFGLRKHEGSNFGEFLNQVSVLVLELMALGVEVSDDELAVVLLNGLPMSHSNLDNVPCVAKEGLIHEGLLKPLDAKIPRGASVGNWVKVGGVCSKGKANVRAKSRLFKCWHCKDEGHMRRFCPRRKSAKEGEVEQGISCQGEATCVVNHGSLDVANQVVWKAKVKAGSKRIKTLDKLSSQEVTSKVHFFENNEPVLVEPVGHVDPTESVSNLSENADGLMSNGLVLCGEKIRNDCKAFRTRKESKKCLGVQADGGLVFGSLCGPYDVLDEFARTRTHGIKPDPKCGRKVAHGESKGSNSLAKIVDDVCDLVMGQGGEGPPLGICDDAGKVLDESKWGLGADLDGEDRLVHMMKSNGGLKFQGDLTVVNAQSWGSMVSRKAVGHDLESSPCVDLSKSHGKPWVRPRDETEVFEDCWEEELDLWSF